MLLQVLILAVIESYSVTGGYSSPKAEEQCSCISVFQIATEMYGKVWTGICHYLNMFTWTSSNMFLGANPLPGNQKHSKRNHSHIIQSQKL